MWENRGSGLGSVLVGLVSLLCLALFFFLGICAAEPIAQIPLPEFKALIGRVDKLQQREKLQAELIQHLREKDQVQTDYIAKMESADEQRERYAEKLEVLANDPRWADRATWAGYGAAVPIAVQVVRKLILKF